jgi:hypothetical protein
MNCFVNCGRPALPSNTLCLECSKVNQTKEIQSGITFRARWIFELTLKIALCGGDGWPFWVSKECREWFNVRWPEYTPRKGYEQDIYALQKELGIIPTVPRWINLCPCTLEMGKDVNAKFEELADGLGG